MKSNGRKLNEKAALVKLTVGYREGWIKDKATTTEILNGKNAKPDAGLFKKKLWGDALSPVHGAYSKLYEHHYQMTLPWEDQRIRIIHADFLMEYLREMSKLKEEYLKKGKEFAQEVQEVIERDKERLGDLFSSADYPDPMRVATWFYMDLKVLPIPDKQDFRLKLQADELSEILGGVDNEVTERLGVAMKDVWGRLHKAVERLIARLESDRMRVDHIDLAKDHLAELCQMLPKLNLNNDPDLNQLRKDVEKRVLKISGDTAKDSEETRVTVIDSAKEIRDKMSDFMAIA